MGRARVSLCYSIPYPTFAFQDRRRRIPSCCENSVRRYRGLHAEFSQLRCRPRAPIYGYCPRPKSALENHRSEHTNHRTGKSCPVARLTWPGEEDEELSRRTFELVWGGGRRFVKQFLPSSNTSRLPQQYNKVGTTVKSTNGDSHWRNNSTSVRPGRYENRMICSRPPCCTVVMSIC